MEGRAGGASGVGCALQAVRSRGTPLLWRAAGRGLQPSLGTALGRTPAGVEAGPVLAHAGRSAQVARVHWQQGQNAGQDWRGARRGVGGGGRGRHGAPCLPRCLQARRCHAGPAAYLTSCERAHACGAQAQGRVRAREHAAHHRARRSSSAACQMAPQAAHAAAPGPRGPVRLQVGPLNYQYLLPCRLCYTCGCQGGKIGKVSTRNLAQALGAGIEAPKARS